MPKASAKERSVGVAGGGETVAGLWVMGCPAGGKDTSDGGTGVKFATTISPRNVVQLASALSPSKSFTVLVESLHSECCERNVSRGLTECILTRRRCTSKQSCDFGVKEAHES